MIRFLIAAIVATIAISTGSLVGEVGVVLVASALIVMAAAIMRRMFRGMFR